MLIKSYKKMQKFKHNNALTLKHSKLMDKNFNF